MKSKKELELLKLLKLQFQSNLIFLEETQILINSDEVNISQNKPNIFLNN